MSALFWVVGIWVVGAILLVLFAARLGNVNKRRRV